MGSGGEMPTWPAMERKCSTGFVGGNGTIEMCDSVGASGATSLRLRVVTIEGDMLEIEVEYDCGQGS